MKSDAVLIKAIENHSFWLNPAENLDEIYNNLSFYSASLIFLHANGRDVPGNHLEAIGDKGTEIPILDYEWMET